MTYIFTEIISLHDVTVMNMDFDFEVFGIMQILSSLMLMRCMHPAKSSKLRSGINTKQKVQRNLPIQVMMKIFMSLTTQQTSIV